MFNSLINNIALLLALSICHILILRRWKPETITYQIVSGIMFGLIIIAGMMNPFVLSKGIIFDGRSLVISVAGLVCGPIAALIAAVIGSIYRVWGIGGGGSLMGVLVLFSSALLGSALHYIARKNQNYLNNQWLYVFGLIVHINMVLLMLTLPSDQIWRAISTLSLPVLILFPIGTMILGRFLLDQIEAAELHESLKISEEKYRELVESANSIILRINKEGCITYFNDYAQSLFGYSAKEAIRKPFVGFIIPIDDSDNPDVSFVNKIFNSPEEHLITETEGKLKNGERIWISWTNKVIHDDDGSPNEIFSIGTNITQRMIADNKLRDSNKYIQEIINNAHEGIIVYDNELRIIVWNEFMERFSGFTADQVIGRHPVEVFPFLKGTAVLRNLELAIQGEAAQATEFPFCVPETNRKGWALDTSGPLRNADGEIIGVIATVQDITKQKKVEEELRESEQSLIKTQQLAQIGRWELDHLTNHLNWSQETYQIYGVDQNQEVDFDFFITLVHPAERESIKELFYKSLENGDDYFEVYHSFFHKLTNEHRYVYGNCENTKDDSGKIVRSVGMVQDITEQRQREKIQNSLIRLVEFASQDPTTNDLLCVFLNEAEILTHSEIGFYHFIEDDQINLTLQAWSSNTKEKYCSAEGEGQHYPIDKAGVWVDCIKTRKPVIHNDYKSLSHKQGMPEGHANVVRELIVPVIRGDKIVAILGVGNKPNNYNDQDVNIIQELADLAWETVEQIRTKEALKKSETQYKDLVDSANSIVLRMDPDLNVIYLNDFAQSVFGFEPSELKGKNVIGTIVPEIDSTGFNLVERINEIKANIEQFKSQENENLCKDGTRLWVNWANKAIRDENGKLVEILSIGNDVTERKKAELAFRQAENRYQTLFSQMLDGFALHEIICDENNKPINYRFLAVNPAFEEMTGLVANEIVGKTVLEIMPDTESYWIEAYGEVALTGKPTQIEHYSKELDRFFSVSAYQPQQNQFACIVEDVTDQKHTELIQQSRIRLVEYAAQYPSSEELLSEFLNEAEKLTNSNVGFYHCVEEDQVHLNLQAWSENTLKNMCTLEGEGRHYPISEAGVWVDCVRKRAPVIHNDYESLAHKKGLPEGHAPIIRELVVPVIRGDKIVAILGVGNKAIDYTERDVIAIQQLADLAWETVEKLKVKEELYESEKRFKELMHKMESVAVQGYTMDGVVFYWNRASEIIYGYEEKEVLGKKILDLIIPEDMREFVKNAIEDMKETKQPIPPSEFMLKRKDGSLVPVYTSHAIVKNTEGDDEFYSFDIDFSDKKESEKALQEFENQLHQSLKMESVGRLAGGVAHDFNNMLSVISGHCELSMMCLSEDDPLKDHLVHIQKATQRSAALTNQLLAFARKQTIDPIIVNLNLSIKNAIKMLEHLIGENIDLIWKPSEETIAVKIDPSQLDQILVNLAVNARDAISGVGQVFISTEVVELDEEICQLHPGSEVGGYVVLSVCDSGCGMDDETKERLFEPFYTTKEKGQGTGLGLSTVYGIVKQNQGFIEVESEVDAGSIFKIYLPRLQDSELNLESCDDTQIKKGGGEIILVVEDNDQLLDVSKAMLLKLGYKVLSANSPSLALEIANNLENQIDLLLTDVIMPEMNGKELYQKIHEIRPEIQCLFMSGYTDDVIANHGVLNEGVNYISKPISYHSLSDKLRKVIEKS